MKISDFFENFEKFRFRTKFRKIAILVKIFKKIFDSNQIFVKTSILVKFSQNFDRFENFRFFKFSKISILVFVRKVRKISILVKFSKISTLVKFSKKFWSNFRNVRIRSKFPKSTINFKFNQILEKLRF